MQTHQSQLDSLFLLFPKGNAALRSFGRDVPQEARDQLLADLQRSHTRGWDDDKNRKQMLQEIPSAPTGVGKCPN